MNHTIPQMKSIVVREECCRCVQLNKLMNYKYETSVERRVGWLASFGWDEASLYTHLDCCSYPLICASTSLGKFAVFRLDFNTLYKRRVCMHVCRGALKYFTDYLRTLLNRSTVKAFTLDTSLKAASCET
jgi:hypothetical protein